MKKLFLWILLLWSPGVNAQGELEVLLETSGTTQEIKSLAALQLDAFVRSMTGTSRGNDVGQLRKTVRGLHKRFLKHYKAYSNFNEIFSSGHYDCLTATALFSNVLDRLHYSYDIIETNYHIFLLVKTAQGMVLVETTDRIGGFVTQSEAIESRIQLYKENIPTAEHSSGYLYQYPFSLYQEISKQNLGGLLYFNQAVKAYNRQDWISCTFLLEKANQLYASPRCEALGYLLIQTISTSALDEKTKADCLVRLKNSLLRKFNYFALN